MRSYAVGAVGGGGIGGPMRLSVGAGMDAVGRTGIDAPMHRRSMLWMRHGRRSMRSGGPMRSVGRSMHA